MTTLTTNHVFTREDTITIINDLFSSSKYIEDFMKNLILSFDISKWDYFLKYENDHKILVVFQHNLDFDGRFSVESFN